MLLNPLPVRAPERLVRAYTTDSTVDIPDFTLLPTSFRNCEDYREAGDVFEAVGFSVPVRVVLGDEETPRAVSANLVSANYFDVLGVPLAIGRGFTSEEDELGGGHAVVVVSHAFWSRELGGDAGVVGGTIELNRHPFTVIGVAPPGFRGTTTLTDASTLFVPTSVHERVGDALAEEYPDANENRGIVLGFLTDAASGATPYRTADESRTARSAASILMSVAALVLLIACANLANLLLARGADREKEMSLRAELGATTARLAQQLLSRASSYRASGARRV